MPHAYRPQPSWLLKGTLLGMASGAAVASGLLVVDVLSTPQVPGTTRVPEDVLGAIVLGVVFGGFAGAVIGLLVGLVLTFALGSHLPVAVERRRALVLGAALPPLALMVVVSVLAGEPVVPEGVELVPLTASMLLGGLLARWAVRSEARRADRTREVASA